VQAAQSAMIADGVERSTRLAAAVALLAFFARRRGESTHESRIDPSRRAAPRSDEESLLVCERDRRRRPWADLLWSLVTLLLLAVVVYTALHGADVLAKLDDLGLRIAY